MLQKEVGMKNGDDSTRAKVCVKCNRILPLDTLVCPTCGGIIFETVDFGGDD